MHPHFISVLFTAIAAQGDVPAEVGTCRTYGDVCKFYCSSPHLIFDLSVLQEQAQGSTKPGDPGYLKCVGTDNDAYFFGACGALSGMVCTGATGSGVPTAIQAWATPSGGAIPSGSCAILGALAPRNCTVTKPGNSMLCKYQGGSDQRHVDVTYVCDPDVPVPHLTAKQLGETFAYMITITGKHMCGVTPPLSPGSIGLIIFSCVVVAYIGGGLAVNVKLRGKPLTPVSESFPQYEYWAELPWLVRDGMLFSWEVAQKAYYQKMGGSAVPNDPSLSARLRDGGSGGGGT